MYYAILSIIIITIISCSQIGPEFSSSRGSQSNTVFTDSKSKQTPQAGNLLKLDYEGFTVWLDCEKRGAIKFQYKTLSAPLFFAKAKMGSIRF
jgi:endonuclease G